MASFAEIRHYLRGAVRLALLDQRGAAYFPNTPQACWRSFQVAILAAPIYAIILAYAPSQALAKAAAVSSAAYVVKGLFYVIGWFLFPIAMYYVTLLLGVRGRYYAYIAAYNWAALLQTTLFLAVYMLSFTGVFGGRGFEGILFGATVAVFVYTGVIAHIMLGVPGLTAAGIVAMDFFLSAFLDMASLSMLQS